MSRIGDYIIQQEEQGNNLLADLENHLEPYLPESDIERGIWYRSAASKLWYRNKKVAGDVDMIRVYGQIYEPAWWNDMDTNEEYQALIAGDGKPPF